MPIHQRKLKRHATYWCETPSPVGPLLLAGDGTSLSVIHFQHGRRRLEPAADWIADHAPFGAAVRQLAEYFAGERRAFDLALDPHGTEFQRSVWQLLGAIPYGETVSYGELARRIGNPRASRAVGLANGSNPLPIVVPCHRVIGSDGSLTGFGGGLDAKRRLLALEGAACARGADARC